MLLKQYIKKKLALPFAAFISFLLTIHIVFLLKLAADNNIYPSPALQFGSDFKSLLVKPSYFSAPPLTLNSALPPNPHLRHTQAVEECSGGESYTPIIAPSPVLDPTNMNYSLKPFSPLRPSYNFQPENMAKASTRPIITILTPFYNTGPFIHDVARCVFGQSLQLFQWIIVNDGSTSKEALDGLAQYRNVDPRVLVIDLPNNKGLPGARNEGIVYATHISR